MTERFDFSTTMTFLDFLIVWIFLDSCFKPQTEVGLKFRFVTIQVFCLFIEFNIHLKLHRKMKRSFKCRVFKIN